MRISKGTQWILPGEVLAKVTDIYCNSDHDGFYRAYVVFYYEQLKTCGFLSMAKFAVMIANGDVIDHVPDDTWIEDNNPPLAGGAAAAASGGHLRRG